MVILGLLIIYLLPRITNVIPPLVCILVLTFVAQGFDLDLRMVGDIGTLPNSLPVFLLPDVPLNFATLEIVPTVAIRCWSIRIINDCINC